MDLAYFDAPCVQISFLNFAPGNPGLNDYFVRQKPYLTFFPDTLINAFKITKINLCFIILVSIACFGAIYKSCKHG